MSPLEQFFPRIFVINLARRADRWAECLEHFLMFGITRYERFEGIPKFRDDGRGDGNAGCVASHRALLDKIVAEQIPHALILEDDFQITRGDAMDCFADWLPEVPADWDFLFLGGHYAEPPIERVSKHVIRSGQMLTTSSYGITLAMATKMAPAISGGGPIDSLYGGFQREAKTYILSPRLMIQRPSYSDLQERHMDNAPAMLDTRHEEMV